MVIAIEITPSTRTPGVRTQAEQMRYAIGVLDVVVNAILVGPEPAPNSSGDSLPPCRPHEDHNACPPTSF
jgi:hypothetical protein